MQEGNEDGESEEKKLSRFKKSHELGEKFASATKANMTLKSGGYDHLESSDFDGVHEAVAKSYERAGKKTGTIVFGGGCFWCTEAVFQMMKGVIETTPGYAGGTTGSPTYDELAYKGNPGDHTEVVRIEYDPNVMPLKTLLEIFFEMHDPTRNDFQGIADYGAAYRSLILYTSNEQKKVIEESMREQQKKYAKPILTRVKKLGRFYEAEEYHKNYYKNHPLEPYCLLVTRPEVNKIKKEFAEYLK